MCIFWQCSYHGQAVFSSLKCRVPAQHVGDLPPQEFSVCLRLIDSGSLGLFPLVTLKFKHSSLCTVVCVNVCVWGLNLK